MAHWLQRQTPLSVAEIAILLSAKGDLRICQVVDPLKTARMEIHRSVLEDLGIRLEDLARV